MAGAIEIMIQSIIRKVDDALRIVPCCALAQSCHHSNKNIERNQAFVLY